MNIGVRISLFLNVMYFWFWIVFIGNKSPLNRAIGIRQVDSNEDFKFSVMGVDLIVTSSHWRAPPILQGESK